MRDEQHMTKMNTAVSIIIPHYNSADTLDRLLESIGNHSDVQVIVVDDNSTKDIAVLRNLEKKYCNTVEFFRNDTGIQSAGACRNVGLEKAQGMWVLFADADDFFTKGWYEIVSKYLYSDYDAIFFTPTSVFEDLKNVGIRHIGQEKMIGEYLDNPSRENYMKCARIHCVWSKLFKRDVIEENRCRCSETMHANDILMSKQLFYFCKKKLFTKEVIYCVTKTNGSLTTIASDMAFNERINEFIKSYKFLESHFDKKDFQHIRMSGGKILYDAYKKGIRLNKLIRGAVELKKNKVRLVAKEYMSPAEFLKTYRVIKGEYKIDEKHIV